MPRNPAEDRPDLLDEGPPEMELDGMEGIPKPRHAELAWSEAAPRPLQARSDRSRGLESLQIELDRKEAALERLRDRFLQQAAEFDHFKKRERKELDHFTQFANEELVKQLLPVLDNLERALETAKQQIPEDFHRKVETIHDQALGLLEQAGVKSLAAVGASFDPRFHEAVMLESSPGLPDNVVVREIRRGYSLNERLIRHALVSVSSRAAGDAGTPSASAG